MERGETVTLKSFGRVTSYIFMKEPIGSSEKILKYVNCTYTSIFVPIEEKMIMCSIFVSLIKNN